MSRCVALIFEINIHRNICEIEIWLVRLSRWHELTCEKKSGLQFRFEWIFFYYLPFQLRCCEQFFQFDSFLWRAFFFFISNFIFVSFCFLSMSIFITPHFGMNVTKRINVMQNCNFTKAITKSYALRCARTSRMRIDLIVNEVHFTSFHRWFFHLECKSIWAFKSHNFHILVILSADCSLTRLIMDGEDK